MSTGFDSKVVTGEIPSRSAVARTNGLKEEPGCRSACVARLNWLSRKLEPPTMALTAPVRGSIATSAAAGPPGVLRTLSIALCAVSCSPRSIVVVTLRPPPKTRPAPYFAISWSFT
jgi:hypothetical protein